MPLPRGTNGKPELKRGNKTPCLQDWIPERGTPPGTIPDLIGSQMSGGRKETTEAGVQFRGPVLGSFQLNSFQPKIPTPGPDGG